MATQTTRPVIDVPAPLRELRRVFEAAGHRLWFVGGCVRDAAMGIEPKDVDLATDATPLEQIALYKSARIRWIGTGFDHGTITAVLDGVPYETTTLRRDVETDGRHAVVEWTRDVLLDLGRRDLTINAMALTFDGELVDPYGGMLDLRRRRVRFVGDAATRIREDHLRILRWFRFFARFGSFQTIHRPDLDTIAAGASSLSDISVERIWSEMRRILTGPAILDVTRAIGESGVTAALGLGDGDALRLYEARRETRDPGALMAAWQGRAAVDVLKAWKSSNDERESAKFAGARVDGPYGIVDAKTDLVDGARRDHVLALLAMRRDAVAIEAVRDWTPPTFPVQGRDLADAGMRPGKAMGEVLRDLKARWIASDFTAGRDDLIALALQPMGETR